MQADCMVSSICLQHIQHHSKNLFLKNRYRHKQTDPTMIRGDEALSFLMDEMTGGTSNTSMTSTNSDLDRPATSRKVRIRMVPEVQDYGSDYISCPETGRDGNIWNPYVCTNRETMSCLNDQESQVPSTNPLVEISRRRAYEKFKKEFYATFQWNAQHAAAAGKESTKEHVSIMQLWEKIPPHSILESLRIVPHTKQEGFKVP